METVTESISLPELPAILSPIETMEYFLQSYRNGVKSVVYNDVVDYT